MVNNNWCRKAGFTLYHYLWLPHLVLHIAPEHGGERELVFVLSFSQGKDTCHSHWPRWAPQTPKKICPCFQTEQFYLRAQSNDWARQKTPPRMVQDLLRAVRRSICPQIFYLAYYCAILKKWHGEIMHSCMEVLSFLAEYGHRGIKLPKWRPL